jgi:rhodanese-related sulfurtransferase
MKSIDGKRMKELTERKGARVVDVSTESNYKKNHIRGAVNIPHNEKNFVKECESRFSKKDEDIVLYGNKQLGGELKDLSTQLEKAGYKSVQQYQADPSEWKKSSLNIQQQFQ